MNKISLIACTYFTIALIIKLVLQYSRILLILVQHNVHLWYYVLESSPLEFLRSELTSINIWKYRSHLELIFYICVFIHNYQNMHILLLSKDASKIPKDVRIVIVSIKFTYFLHASSLHLEVVESTYF